jgi:hypothetical protein
VANGFRKISGKPRSNLARVHGLNPTAAALKLSYYDLQRRLLRRRLPPRRPLTPAAFVQLTPPAAPPGLGEGGTLELVQASGARLTLRLPNASAKDLVPLVHLILRHRS